MVFGFPGDSIVKGPIHSGVFTQLQELPCSGTGRSTTGCGKEKSNKLKEDKPMKKPCWKCYIYHGIAICMRQPHPLAGSEQVLLLPFQDRVMLVVPTNRLFF